MEFQTLRGRALFVRKLYAAWEKRRLGREWNGGEIAQGFVTDVGALMKLVQAKEGIRSVEDVDQKLAHELSDCLWCVFVLADKYGVDLEKVFPESMDALEKRVLAEQQ